jgi:hypothetical protein
MMDVLKIKGFGRQRLTSVLGLTLDGGRLEGAVVRRANGALQITQTVSAALSLDPLTAAPELVGREIRNHLDAAGISERHCVFGLPLKWALLTHVDLPNLPEPDVAGFLQIEAERGFPCDVATLHVTHSRCRVAAGKEQALMVGVPRNHLATLEQIFRAAKLKPVSFLLPITVLQSPTLPASDGVLALAIGEAQVSLQITSHGGVAALRAIEGALENQVGRRTLNPGVVSRESRITLGQLPAELREHIRRIRIFGPADLAQQMADEMELRFEPSGIKVEVVTQYGPGEYSQPLPPRTPVSVPVSLAAQTLSTERSRIELMPPKVAPWRQYAARYGTGKWRTAGLAAASVAAIILLAFMVQQWQLGSLRARWKNMSAKVHELEGVQQQIRQVRPWYDDSLRGLTILRQLTAAFPETGIVSAKTVEIRDMNTVTCTGVTQDNPSLIKVLEQLRATGSVTDLRLSNIRGTKAPLQFTFDFHWNEGGKSEN